MPNFVAKFSKKNWENCEIYSHSAVNNKEESFMQQASGHLNQKCLTFTPTMTFTMTLETTFEMTLETTFEIIFRSDAALRYSPLHQRR